jgi:hypothetical protein
MFRWIDTASLGTRLLLGLSGWLILFAVIALAHFVSWEFAIIVGILALVGVALLTGIRAYPGVRVYPHDESNDRAIRRAIRRGRDTDAT